MMTNKFTRRNAIAMSVAAPTMGMANPMGGEIDASMVGVNIKIAWSTTDGESPDYKCETGWCVWLPDFEAMAPGTGRYWRPGQAVPGKWILLRDYLVGMEAEYNLVARS